MPKKAGMEAWKKKRRQEYLEKKKYRYYIFCEGEQTEPQYFAGFKKLIFHFWMIGSGNWGLVSIRKTEMIFLRS